MSDLSTIGGGQEEFDAGLDAMFEDMDNDIDQAWTLRDVTVLNATKRLNDATKNQASRALSSDFGLADAA